MGSIGAAKNNTRNVPSVTTEVQNTTSYRMGMTKEERRQWTENAPVGTKIEGLVDRRTGRSIEVEKVTGYSMPRATLGGGVSRLQETYWTVNGSKDPYINRTLREAEEGTSKYYRFRRS